MSNLDAYDYLLDVSGLICPEPVMLLHNTIRDRGEGEVIKILATDPSTQRDIPKFCEFLNHELIECLADEDTFVFLVKKGKKT